MADVNSLRDLFLHELGDMLYAEQKITKMLPELREQTTDSELGNGFEMHLEQTQTHVRRLEEAFDLLEAQPRAEHNPAIEGIKAEHDEHFGDLAEELRDVFNASAAMRTEHFEISGYESLIAKAQALEEQQVAALLYDNLNDEKETLQDLHTVEERLATALGSGSAMA